MANKHPEFDAVIILDGNGVQITSFGGSGGTSMSDDAAFTPGSSSVTPAGFLADDTGTDPLDEGDIGAARLNPTTRIIYVQLKDNAGDDVSVGGGTQYTEDAAAAANPVGNALIMVRDDALSGQTTTDGDNVAARGTDKGELYIKHADTVVVDGSGVTQPVSHAALTELAAAINSNLVDVNIVSGAGSGGTAQADDADFTAGTTQGTPAMGVYESSPSSVTDGDLGVVGITQARRLKTSATIDAALPAGTNAIGKLAANSGVDIGDVDVLTLPAITGTVTADAGTNLNTSALLTTAAHDAAFGTAGAADAQVRTIQGVASMTPVQVSQATAANLNMTEASAAAIAASLSVVDDWDETDRAKVNLIAGQAAITAGAGAVAANTPRVTHASDDPVTTALQIMDDWDNGASDGASISGDVAHDTADAGEPVKVGGKAYSPDGTTPGTAVAENDRSNFKTDLDGIQYVQTMNPQNFSYHDDDAAAVTTDGTLKADPGDGFAVCITDLVFSIGAATASSIFVEEGSTKILGPYYLEAIAGRGLSIHFNTPKRCTASTAILVTNTGSILFGIDALGFVSAV